MSASHDGGMTDLEPATAFVMPPKVGRTQQLLTSIARVRIVKFVLHHPGCTTTQLMTATGYSQTAVRLALADFEDAGFIAGDDDQARCVGRAVHYTAHRETVTDALLEFTSWILR